MLNGKHRPALVGLSHVIIDAAKKLNAWTDKLVSTEPKTD